MKQKVANYTVIIERQKRTGTNKTCYNAYVPVLGVATDADSAEQAQKDIQALVQFHIESLVEEGEKIPVETAQAIVKSFAAKLPENALLASQ